VTLHKTLPISIIEDTNAGCAYMGFILRARVRHAPPPTLEATQVQIDALFGQLPTRIGWHLWETDLRFAPGLPPGWDALPAEAFASAAPLRSQPYLDPT